MNTKKYLLQYIYRFTPILLLIGGFHAHAQTLAVWSFEDKNDSPAYVAEGIHAGSMVRGGGLIYQSGAFGTGCDESAWAIQMSGWTLDKQPEATDFYQFTIQPVAGYTLDMYSFTFLAYSTSTGPRMAVMRSSLDNFSADISEVLKILPNQCNEYTIKLEPAYQNLHTPVTFRIYGFGALDAAGAFLLDNVGSQEMLLPFSIGLLYASSEAGNNKLTWQGNQSIQSDHWSVEKSYDGLSFFSVGKVPILNTPSGIFEFTDNNVKPGRCYYRVALVDQNNHFHYSNIVSVTSQGIMDKWAVYPNPFSASLWIKNTVENDQSTLQVFNASGQIMYAGTAELLTNIETADWPNGIYFISLLHSASESEIFRIVKQ